jgi:hypothetical protein
MRNSPDGPSAGTKAIVGLCLAAVLLGCCIVLPWSINQSILERISGPSFTTDQVIASFGVMVTGFGIFIAIAAVGLAALAILGFSELRNMVHSRHEEGMKTLNDATEILTGKIEHRLDGVRAELIELLKEQRESEGIGDLRDRLEPVKELEPETVDEFDQIEGLNLPEIPDNIEEGAEPPSPPAASNTTEVPKESGGG